MTEPNAGETEPNAGGPLGSGNPGMHDSGPPDPEPVAGPDAWSGMTFRGRYSGSRGGSWGPNWGPPPSRGWGPPGRTGWGSRRGPRHATGAIGCVLIVVILFIGLITALATWVAGSLLGVVAPGSGASVPVTLAVLVGLIVVAVAIARFVGRTVRPLASMADATERLADGDPNVRVAIGGPRPVRRLATSFNAMAERLDRSRADRQALLADVTHELRTPLQVIGGSVEAMLDGVHPLDEAHLAPILAETAVMNRLLDDLRTLSLAEAGALPLHREEVDVPRLLEEVVASHQAAAQERGITLAAVQGSPIRLDADPVRLREVLANLVVNAIRHTPAGGSISLRATSDGDWVELTVADTGEGIPPADLERVFDRFERRVDAGGSGLGLTIARDLVVAHGGTIRAESDGVAGHGTTVRIRLPRRD